LRRLEIKASRKRLRNGGLAQSTHFRPSWRELDAHRVVLEYGWASPRTYLSQGHRSHVGIRTYHPLPYVSYLPQHIVVYHNLVQW
jgi:hypothetical protein